MNINEMFPDKYLKAEDLQGRRVAVTISEVAAESIRNEDKPVLYLKGKSRGLVLNKTNAATIEEITGTPDTDLWGGKKIILYGTRVDFQGKRVPAIRIDPPDNGAPALAAKPDIDNEDEIPF